MSADNWTYCPRCTADADSADEKRRKAVEAKYGKVPAEEYLEAVRALDANPTKREETLREDYTIGIFEGTFEIAYGAHCGTCGLKYEYKYEATVPLAGPRREDTPRDLRRVLRGTR